MALTYNLLKDGHIDDVIVKNFFPLFFKMAESFENFGNILPDWANEDVGKSLAEAADRYVKQEVERKTCFFVENDLDKILQQSYSSTTKFCFFIINKTNRFHVMLLCVCSLRSQMMSKCAKKVSDGNLESICYCDMCDNKKREC